MNKRKIKDKITPLIGNLYLYHTREVRVEGVALLDEQIEIHTNRRTIRFPYHRLDEELDNFLPVEDEGSDALINQREQVESQALAMYRQDAGRMNKLEETIMNNIGRLQGEDGKQYLEQAKAVNENVKTLLDMTKTKLKMHQEIRKSKKMKN